MMRVIERYNQDPAFHGLVDMITSVLLEGKYTPTEVREAAMLAQLKYESMTPPRPVIFSLNDLKSGKV